MGNRISSLLKELNVFRDLVVPRSKSEKRFFVLLFVLYASYALFFGMNTYLLDHPTIKFNLILGLDNPAYFQSGYNNIVNHPFLFLLTIPLVTLGNLLAMVIGYKAKTVLIVGFCIYLIAQGQILVKRYLTQIVELDPLEATIISISFIVFGSNLILSMVFESFTVTFFLLCLTTFYLSQKLKSGEQIPIVTGALMVFFVAGTTISNAIKPMTAFVLEKNTLREKLKRLIQIGLPFGIAYILLLSVQSLLLKQNRIGTSLTIFSSETNSQENLVQDYWPTFLSQFFGAPILLPKFTLVGQPNPMSILSNYDLNWQFVVVAVVFILILWSIFVNLKSVLVQFLAINFSFDLILHAVLEYGFWESFIYAGHWIVTVPLLIGWLIKSQRGMLRKLILWFLIPFTLVILINNYFRLLDLYRFGLEYYATN